MSIGSLDKNRAVRTMILVILLEIVGFLFLIEYVFGKAYLYNIFNKLNIFVKLSQKQLVQIILLALLLFFGCSYINISSIEYSTSYSIFK